MTSWLNISYLVLHCRLVWWIVVFVTTMTTHHHHHTNTDYPLWGLPLWITAAIMDRSSSWQCGITAHMHNINLHTSALPVRHIISIFPGTVRVADNFLLQKPSSPESFKFNEFTEWKSSIARGCAIQLCTRTVIQNLLFWKPCMDHAFLVSTSIRWLKMFHSLFWTPIQ